MKGNAAQPPSGQCYETQLQLFKDDPEGVFTGYIEMEVPKNLLETHQMTKENRENLSLARQKAYHRMKRMAAGLGITMNDIAKVRVLHISKHHWRESALIYAKRQKTAVQGYHIFSSNQH